MSRKKTRYICPPEKDVNLRLSFYFSLNSSPNKNIYLLILFFGIRMRLAEEDVRRLSPLPLPATRVWSTPPAFPFLLSPGTPKEGRLLSLMIARVLLICLDWFALINWIWSTGLQLFAPLRYTGTDNRAGENQLPPFSCCLFLRIRIELNK